MRILHVTPSYKPAYVYGGPTVSVSYLCEAQVQLGHSITVFTTTANGYDELNLPEKSIVDGVTVYYFTRWVGDHVHLAPRLIYKFWRDCREYDLIHIHSWWNLVAVVSTIICIIRGINPVLSPRGMLSGFSLEASALKRMFHNLVGRFLLEKTILHFTSDQEFIMSKEKITQKSSKFFAPNIIKLPEQTGERYSNKRLGSSIRFLFMARIHPVKNIEMMFEALSEISYKWSLMMCGTGEVTYVNDLKQLAKKLEIESRIQWLDWIDDNQKEQIFAQADLFLLTSFSENFSNSVLESLAFGVPVLITDTIGISSVVKEHDLGWIVNVDAKAIAVELEKIGVDGKLLLYKSQRCKEVVTRLFSPTEIAEKYIHEYRTSLFVK